MTARLLALAFAVLYFACGLGLHRSSPMAFAYLDQLFDADVPSRIIDLTRFSGPHHRTQFHPLFLLVLNPPGVALKATLRVLGIEQAGRVAAILLCALAGGAGVGTFFSLLRRSGLAPGLALAWSLVFGLSASQWFFSVFPETYVFSTLALLVLFALAGGRLAPVVAGVIAFGMNVTNLAAVVLARAAGLDWRREGQASLTAVGRLLAVVLAAAAALSLLQSVVYEDTAPFWSTRSLGRDDRLSFVWPGQPRDVAVRGGELVAYFFFWNLAAPRTVLSAPDPPRKVVDFPPPSLASFRPPGMAHALVWTAVLVLAGVSAVRAGPARPPLLPALALWLIVLAGLHLVFGTSLFLYTGQWTFAVLLLVALLLGDGRTTSAPPRLVAAAVVSLAALQAWANGELLVEIARTFVA